MRINEFLTESQQRELQDLQEGPLGSLVKAAGRGIGKVAGGAAKAVGAVAGGVAGLGSAFKKGYQAGANAVGGPGAAQSAPSAASSNAGSAELDQLKATLQAMDQRLRRAGFESKK